VALVAVCVLLSACDGTSAAATGGWTTSGLGLGLGSAAPTPAPTPVVVPAVLHIFPADRATDVRPDVPVTVRASSGAFNTITLASAAGEAVAGQTGPDGVWKTSELLRPSTAYTIRVVSPGRGGTMSTTRSTFRTLRPAIAASYGFTPRGGTVGVGMPVILKFASAVTNKAMRAEVEKRVAVTTVPDQVGAWGWADNRTLEWRPRSYWIPGTKVTVSATLHGVQTGVGKWVREDGGTSFTVGPSMVSSVDIRAHKLTVRRNGTVIRTFPVSTGKAGKLTETRSGVKVIIERSSVMVMDSATVGIPKGRPGYYKMTVNWNLRVTLTGEFLHSAPWSVASQGFENVSHGCTNLPPAAAEWMFKNSRMGDVVSFTGSSRPFKPSEGIGVWVYDFAGWQARSAIS
jgi:lipoprotein-anchoring transpeptidase ErfK/SrfK